MKQQTLSRRIARIRAETLPDSRAELSDMTLAQFFEGVAILTDKAYPIWLARKLAVIYHLPPDYPYRKLVSFATQKMGTKYEDEGLELLYRLLVEPCLLLAQSEQIQNRQTTSKYKKAR